MRSPDWRPVIPLFFTTSALLWTFVKLGGRVLEGEPSDLDTKLLLLFRNPADLSDPVGPQWLEEMVRDFTALGGTLFLSFLTIGVCCFFILLRRLRTAIFIAVSVGSGLLLSSLAKGLFERPRPDLVPHGSYIYTESFPSGHSMMAAVTYITLAALIIRHVPTRAIKVYILAIALLLTVGVGLSRIYLGVHWPSDVLAGWTGGTAWALICSMIGYWLSVRHIVDAEPKGIR